MNRSFIRFAIIGAMLLAVVALAGCGHYGHRGGHMHDWTGSNAAQLPVHYTSTSTV